jgi:hypothetical protein
MPNAKCQISKANKHNAKKRGEKKQTQRSKEAKKQTQEKESKRIIII